MPPMVMTRVLITGRKYEVHIAKKNEKAMLRISDLKLYSGPPATDGVSAPRAVLGGHYVFNDFKRFVSFLDLERFYHTAVTVRHLPRFQQEEASLVVHLRLM